MIEKLKKWFEYFAESECKDSSGLYYHLSLSIAEDNELLKVASKVANDQPPPNLLFAAVHYLLLVEYYASYTALPLANEKAFPEFKRFVLEHENKIIHLLKNRLVQTNEVRRCSYLYPAIMHACDLINASEISLIEIGTSAGLNLLVDQFQYGYGDERHFGNESSDVLIESRFVGTWPSALKLIFPKVSQRIGLDLNIVDTTDKDASDWLCSLIWPEHHERKKLMKAALEKAKELKSDLRVGDGFAMIQSIVEEIPDSSIPCIYHTHVANQISEEERVKMLDSVDEIGKHRDVIHIFNNIKPTLHCTVYKNGKALDFPIAKTEGHARWIDWLAD